MLASSHDIIARVDGHGVLLPGYMEKAVRLLEETGAANVGGLMLAVGETPFEQAVARAYGSKVGLGGGSFHVGGTEGPAESVYLGVFRREVLERLGGFNDHYHRAQDWELNFRIRQAGELVWFSPDLAVTYRPRSSWPELVRQFFHTGRWRREVIRQYPDTVSRALPRAAGRDRCHRRRRRRPGSSVPSPGCPLLRRGWLAPLMYVLGVLLASFREGRGLPVARAGAAARRPGEHAPQLGIRLPVRPSPGCGRPAAGFVDHHRCDAARGHGAASGPRCVRAERPRGCVARPVALWNRRRAIKLLVTRDLKVRYASSTLGYLWSVLEPLLLAGIYWFIFTQIFTRTVGVEPYIVFLLAGLLPWTWFNGAVTDAARALHTEAKLVRSTNVPREVWVVRVVLSKGVEFLLSLPVLFLFAVDLLGADRLAAGPADARRPPHGDARARRRPAARAPGGAGARPGADRADRAAARLLRLAGHLRGAGRARAVGRRLRVQPARRNLRTLPCRLLPGCRRLGPRGLSAAVSVGLLVVGWCVFARLERTVLKEI